MYMYICTHPGGGRGSPLSRGLCVHTLETRRQVSFVSVVGLFCLYCRSLLPVGYAVASACAHCKRGGAGGRSLLPL